MTPVIDLRAIEQVDLAKLRDWRNDLRKNFRQWYPLGMEDQETWFRSIQSRDRHVMFAVWTNAPDVPPEHTYPILIGVVGLTHIDWRVRRAEASIYIGPPAIQGMGYGKAALQTLLKFGFDEMGLRRIEAYIFRSNTESVGLFESCSFKFEGAQRDADFRNGGWRDVLMYSILIDEWNMIQ